MMKIVKNISFLLAITVLMTSFTIPFAASVAETVYLDENFNNYAGVADLGVAVDTGENWIVDRESEVPAVSLGTGKDNTNAVKVTRTAGSEIVERMLDSDITDSKVVFTFKMMSDYTNSTGGETKHTTIVSFANGHASNDRLQFLFVDGGKIYTCVNRANDTFYLCDSVSKKWYDVEIVFDATTDDETYSIKISDETGVLASNEGLTSSAFSSAAVLDKVDRIKIQTWGGETGCSSTTFDDIKVMDYVPEVPDMPETGSGYYNEDFNNYADVSGLMSAWVKSTATNAEAVTLGKGEDGSNAITITRADSRGETFEGILNKEITDGEIKVTFKMMNDYTDASGGDTAKNTAVISLAYGHNSNDRIPLLYIKDGVMYTAVVKANDARYLGPSVSKKWYNVTVIFNATEGTYKITVSDGTTRYKMEGLSVAGFSTAVNLDTIDRIRLNNWDGTVGYGSLTIDDIVIQDYVPSEEDEDEGITSAVIFEDNFNRFETVDALKTIWLKSAATDSASLSLGTGEDQSRAIKVTRTGASESVDAVLTQVVEAGKFEATFNMMNDYTDEDGEDTARHTTVISFCDGKDLYIPIIYINGAKAYTGVNKASTSNYLGDVVSGRWYEVKAQFNLNNWTYDISIFDGSNVYKREGNSVKAFGGATSMQKIDRFRLQTWDGVAGLSSLTVDDVLVKYSTEAIDVKASDLSFVNADGNAGSLAAVVPASTEKIAIDFKTVMNSASLNFDTVILKNETDNEVVSYTKKLEGNIYTMTLPNLLAPGKDYSLTITTCVKNASDIPAEEEKMFVFKTDSGECNVGFQGISIGDNKSPSVSDILSATSMSVSVDVINATGVDKDLLIIVAYYNNDEMIDVIYHEKELPCETYVNGAITETVTLKSGVNADSVQIFVWDTIGGMTAYDENAIISAQ